MASAVGPGLLIVDTLFVGMNHKQVVEILLDVVIDPSIGPQSFQADLFFRSSIGKIAEECFHALARFLEHKTQLRLVLSKFEIAKFTWVSSEEFLDRKVNHASRFRINRKFVGNDSL